MNSDTFEALNKLAALINHRITNGHATRDEKALLDAILPFQEEPECGFSGEPYCLDAATATGMYDD